MCIGNWYQKNKIYSSFPRRRESSFFAEMDYSLRSPFGSPVAIKRKTRLSRLRGNDEDFFKRLASRVSPFASCVSHLAARCRSNNSSRLTRHYQRGFSLVELIIGMVVMSIALVTLTTVLYPQFIRGLDPIFQMRAAELGQSLADEILGKAYDQTTPVGGQPVCNPCSDITRTAADSDGQARNQFDDVDDYNSYCPNPVAITDANGAVPTGFENYQMQICVDYAGGYSGSFDGNRAAKLIVITIFPPTGGQAQSNGERIEFRVYRSNF